MGDVERTCGDLSSSDQNYSMPRNLFERILIHTNKISSLEEENCHKFNTVAGGKCTVMNEEPIDIRGDLIVLIDAILCRKTNVAVRIMKLKYVTERFSEDASILEFDMCARLLKYCESLLISYCDPSSKSNEELLLVMPLLSLFLSYTCCVETNKIDLLFMRNSNFLYQLMRVCVMCVAGSLSLCQELKRITLRKKLAGRVQKVGKEDTMDRLIRSLGVQTGPNQGHITPAIGLPMESYIVTLYDTSESLVEKNINEHLAGMNSGFFSGCDLNSDNVSKDHENEERHGEIWSDVVVSHVFPFEGFVAYLKGDWDSWLKLINGELVEFMRSSTMRKSTNDESEIKIGCLVGFWCTDVTFRWKPPLMVQCLRGIIIGKAAQEFEGEEGNMSWAIWAIDVGTLVLGKKVWLLKDNLTSIPPLASFCSLNFQERGGDGGEFLLVALKLLFKLLSTNPSAGWHMLAFGPRKCVDDTSEDSGTCDGGFMLRLIEHPDIEIRIESLKLILFLARSTSEVVRYLVECRFDLAVYCRLEMCVHFSVCVSSDSALWTEIRFLIMILSAMAEGSETDMTQLPEHGSIQKVLIMLTQVDNHPYVRYMAAKCLASLESHKITKTNTEESKRHGLRHVHKDRPKDRPGSIPEKHFMSNSFHQPLLAKGCDIETKDSDQAELELDKPVLSVIDVGDEETSDEESTSVDAMADLTRDMDHYTKGYKVNIYNDMTHELSQEKNVCQVSENRLSQIICGFLNNGVGGSVYFGITSRSLIEGLKMTRSERDNFRKGVDRLMTRSIYPEVRAACYDVRYVPVFSPGDVFNGLSFHRNWIIEVHIKALPHAIYTVTANRKCYVRRGSICVESMSVGLRQEAAEQTKKEIIQAIEEVKAKIPENREKLFRFVSKYLEKTRGISSTTP